MLEGLDGVDLWDGTAARGTSTIRFAADGRDAVVASVEPAAHASGLVVVPGLIDTHVHLVGESTGAGADFLTWPLTTRPEERVLHGLANARRALAAGITTLRDLAADDVQFSLRRALDAGVVTGPRLLAHGMVGMTGGHADLFVPPAVRDRPPVADGPDECRRLVRHWARAGADGIKIATSGGVLSIGDRPAWRNHTAAEVAAIVDEAHALGMRVAAHAHTAEGIRVALDHGVDSIEHGTLIEPAQAARMAASGIPLAPTLLINDRIAAGSGAAAGKAGDLVAQRDERLRAAAGAGVDLVLGTDANGFHVGFGEEHLELLRMAAVLGWPAERVLRAATSRAAAAIGRPDLGVLSPGAKADLVVLRGRPWEDLSALEPDRVVAVVSRGEVVAGALSGPERREEGEATDRYRAIVRGAIGAAAVLPIVLLLAGCGFAAPRSTYTPTITVAPTDAPAPTSASSSPSPSPTPTDAESLGPLPTPGRTAADPGRPAGQCPDEAIGVSIVPSPDGGAAGSRFADVLFTNTGGQSCVLRGAPDVAVLAGGTRIGPSATHAEAAARLVRLAVGQTAVARLQITNIDPGGGPLGDACAVRHGDGYRVVPPHSDQRYTVQDSTAVACADGPVFMTVGPVERRPSG